MSDEQESARNLQKLIETARTTAEGRLSRPDFLRLIGIPDSQAFPSQVKALERFEQNLDYRLPPYLRARLLQHFRKELPDMDALDFSLYAEEAAECNNLHTQLKVFHKIPDNRVDEVARAATGRFLIYKKPVHRMRKGRVLRSYARIERPYPSANFMMIIEYQKGIYRSAEIGTQVDHDFFVGICTKKDGVMMLLMRQLHSGALKNIFLDAVAIDADSGLMNRGFGNAIEICDNFSPERMAYSKCALQRIPDGLSAEAIDALIDDIPTDQLDDVIANHLLND